MKNTTSLAGRIFRIKELGILIGLIVLCLALSVRTDTFLSMFNLSVVMRQASYIGIVAFGQTLVLLLGGIDLSGGAIAGLSAILTTMIMTAGGVPPHLAVALGVVIGAVFGLVNGILVAYLKINSFIATLATGEIYAGAILVITEGYPVLKLPRAFSFWGQGLFRLPIPGTDITVQILVPVIILILLLFVFLYTLTCTPFGRNIYAIGGNQKASRLAGVRVERTMLAVYAISGAAAALAGIILASRMNAGQPTIGSAWVMPCITAAIIGGTSLKGGEGTIVGTILGAVFMSVLANGITLLGISPYWERVIVGIVVILAVVIDVIRNRK